MKLSKLNFIKLGREVEEGEKKQNKTHFHVYPDRFPEGGPIMLFFQLHI